MFNYRKLIQLKLTFILIFVSNIALADNHNLNDADCDIQEYGPILKNSIGWVACSKREIIEAGDHFIILGDVDEISSLNDKRKPLVFWSGKFQNLK